jgi:two-component system copper resistance phosphate regulon response regulator CusR/two-component system response regulator MprA
MRILIVEDEPRMLELLRRGLQEHGFAVITAADGQTGLEIATNHDFDAIVLDIGLPQLDGYALMRALREIGRATPVLMLTARDAEDDIIHGLDVGADDYMTKPFSFPELVARLQSITRRHRDEGHATIRVGDIVLDPARRTVTLKNESVDLTRLEFLLLTCLLRRTGECVPRQSLIECIWGRDHAVGPNALDVLVNALRAKIDAPYRTKQIITVRGVGYLFACDAAAREETQ